MVLDASFSFDGVIGALALILLVTIEYEINEINVGPIGVILIGASFWSPVRRNKRLAKGY